MVEQLDRMKRLRDRAVRKNLLGKESAGFVVFDILTLFDKLDKTHREMKLALDAQRDGKWALTDAILMEALKEK